MIDAHLHIGHKGRSLEDTIRHIEGIGADKAVCLPIETSDREYEWLTEYVASAYERYPDRIIPFCHVDVTREDALGVLEQRARTGIFKGFGEQKQHIPLTHPGLAFPGGRTRLQPGHRTFGISAAEVSKHKVHRSCAVLVGTYQR